MGSNATPMQLRLKSGEITHEESLAKACDEQFDLEKPDLNTEYLQLAVLFAAPTSFAVVFPLGPLFAFIHTFVSRSSDAFKLLTLNKRKAPRNADIIIADTWIEIFDVIS